MIKDEFDWYNEKERLVKLSFSLIPLYRIDDHLQLISNIDKMVQNMSRKKCSAKNKNKPMIEDINNINEYISFLEDELIFCKLKS